MKCHIDGVVKRWMKQDSESEGSLYSILYMFKIMYCQKYFWAIKQYVYCDPIYSFSFDIFSLILPYKRWLNFLT